MQLSILKFQCRTWVSLQELIQLLLLPGWISSEQISPTHTRLMSYIIEIFLCKGMGIIKMCALSAVLKFLSAQKLKRSATYTNHHDDIKK